MIIVDPSPKYTDQEKKTIATYFGSYSQDQSIENNPKIILTNPLRRWNDNNSSSHLSANSFKTAEHVALNILSIEFK